MKILIVNAGSSSLKYQLIDMDNEKTLAKGLVERIGIAGSRLKQTAGDKEHIVEIPMNDHVEASKQMLKALTDDQNGVVKNMDDIGAVGHRVVHGGEDFTKSTLIDDNCIKAIEENSPFAPLHNPANLMGIKATRMVMPNTPMVAVFDTSFHQTMPRKGFLYGLPMDYYKRLKVRRYGFHGTSHRFVSQQAAKLLNKKPEELKIITCHLGNGSSICAVEHGKSVDTSMGMTPLEGVVMGTRSGNVDPASLQFIMKQENLDIDQMLEILNKKSGLHGLSEVSSDMRDIEAAAADGNINAQAALDVLYTGIKKYIGAYAAVMGGVDVVVFTAGIGENSPNTRKAVCEGMEFLGMKLDLEENSKRGGARVISAADSKVKILVVPTDEELVIAQDTLEIVSKLS
ncbi:MAG: acetate kinase [Bacillota bacterium]|nr:acetate kinase [Bacillota bacterium]